MGRGRPPNPDAINYLKGDPGKRRRYEATVAAPEGRPVAPEYLCDVARVEWESTVEQLETMGLLSKVDSSALVSYVEAWARYRQAAEWITANGPIDHSGRYSPMNRVVRENQALVRSYLIEFGLTPAARARMRVKPKEEKPKSKWSGVLKIGAG